MIRPRRLSICYVAPGSDFRPGSAHSRQVLALARALARHADVAVVFRRLAGSADAAGVAVAALEGGTGPSDRLAPSRRALGRFVEQQAARYDVLLEAGGSMPGRLTAWCGQRGVPAIPILDSLPSTSWLGSLDPGSPWLGIGSSGRYLRRAPVIVAGSRGLGDAIVERWRVDSGRIVIIAPAVDREVFAPRDQAEARRRLGLGRDERIVVAGDGLCHDPDLSPLIQAVQRAGDPRLRLHILGDGERRPALERLAGPGPSVTFHGWVSEDLLVSYIAAADLCVSVEDSGDSAFTISECLSSARAVVAPTVADRLPTPVQHLVNGFAIEHDLLAWIRFLQRDCLSRNALRTMGMAASGSSLEHLDRTAAAYLAVIDRVCRFEGRPAAAV
jgi:glycosyl transferase family 1/glycosyl transferase family 4